MKILENNHGGNWFDRLLNKEPWCVDEDTVESVFLWAWDAQGRYRPADLPGKRSLFYNGYVMVRITKWGAFLHVKLRRDTRSQFGIGRKLNGRFGLIFRPWHTDKSAAAGAPNHGQATAWERGTA